MLPRFDPPLAAHSAPPILPAERHVRDADEVLALRARIADLLEEIKHGAAQGTPETRTEFVAMLSHELRNPLQSMAMALRLLATTVHVNPTVAQAHRVLDRQIGHLSRLLDDLLDASRMASGKIVLQLAPLSLRDAINAAVETSDPDRQQRQQYLALDLPDEHIAVNGDLVRLAQVFSNLLVNASRFTPAHGSIAVTAVCGDTTVEITVSDNGAGIPVELQPYIFELCTQGPCTLERAHGGLGIGLSLVETIVRMHGGSVTVHSAGAGAGSCFSVNLPLTAVSPAVPELPGTNAAPSRTILIIEDNVDANEIMAMLLGMQGHQVTSSYNGVDGLRLALEGEFDIVLCDLGLPGLTGLEVVAAIKASRPDTAPVVIATTGYTDGAQRDLARAAGFDHYLVKPVDLAVLYQVIAGAA
jgi:signal transduction histidine kinase/CheY-like chemotaxis protein